MRKIRLLLLYKTNRTSRDFFINQLNQYIERISVDIILGDFNIDGFTTEESRLVHDTLQNYELSVDFPTHIDGGMLDHIWIRKDLLNVVDMKVTRKCLNNSDHDAVKVQLSLIQDDY